MLGAAYSSFLAYSIWSSVRTMPRQSLAESMGFKGDFRQWEAQLEDARRTLGIVALPWRFQ